MATILIAVLRERAEGTGFEQIQKVIWKMAVSAIQTEIFPR